MHISTGACRGQKRILDYLKLGVIGHCACLMWVLGHHYFETSTLLISCTIKPRKSLSFTDIIFRNAYLSHITAADFRDAENLPNSKRLVTYFQPRF